MAISLGTISVNIVVEKVKPRHSQVAYVLKYSNRVTCSSCVKVDFLSLDVRLGYIHSI